MKRVTGIGGVFFKCTDPKAARDWYARHLGINSDDYGAVFRWKGDESNESGYTVWNPFKADTAYFSPSLKDYMINYRVENLEELMRALEEEGVTIIGKIEEYEYGKFGWIMDPEGNKIELWEPAKEV